MTTETKSIAIIDAPELAQLEGSKADMIRKTFAPMSEMLQTFEDAYAAIVTDAKSGIDKTITARAKRLRLDIGRVRIETGKLKDKQKEYIKAEDRAIMGVHNILVWAVKEKEDKLSSIEKHFETLEKQRMDALQRERVELIAEYVDDAGERNLAVMDDDVWEAYFGAKKKAYDDRIEAEKQAELARIKREAEEQAERERIRVENERLKKEAEEREVADKIARAERERIEAEQRAEHDRQLQAERAERARAEASARAEQEKVNAKIAKEKAEREKAEKARRALEQKRLDEERAKAAELQRQIDEERRLKEEADAKEKAEREKAEKARNDKKVQSDRNHAITLAINEIISVVGYALSEEAAKSIADAIMAGKIPHVKYVG